MTARWTVLVLCGAAVFARTQGQTDTVGVAAADTVDSAAARVRNPFAAGLLSAVVPGAGQLYNRNYVKSVLFLGAEGGLVAAAIYRAYEAGACRDSVKRFNTIVEHLFQPGNVLDPSWLIVDSLTRYDSTFDTSGAVLNIDSARTADTLATLTTYRMRQDSAAFGRQRRVHGTANAITWAAGCYVWSILDAVEKTGRLENDEPRNPKLAGWLSAIPGLGLGQIYNGKLSKAGMIMMVQASLAVMSYNYHSEFAECERQLQVLENDTAAEHAVDLAYGYTFSDEWDEQRKNAFRNRNTYLWYSIFFYLYGIFDAVVDAHLHDYRSRMRLEPDLQVPVQQVGFRLTLELPPARRATHSEGADRWR